MTVDVIGEAGEGARGWEKDASDGERNCLRRQMEDVGGWWSLRSGASYLRPVEGVGEQERTCCSHASEHRILDYEPEIGMDVLIEVPSKVDG